MLGPFGAGDAGRVSVETDPLVVGRSAGGRGDWPETVANGCGFHGRAGLCRSDGQSGTVALGPRRDGQGTGSGQVGLWSQGDETRSVLRLHP